MIKSLNFLGFGTGRGGLQAVRKKNFIGYNENISIGEDIDFFKRLKKKGQIAYLSDLTIYESRRRYNKEGYFKIVKDWTKSGISNFLLKKPYNPKRKLIR